MRAVAHAAIAGQLLVLLPNAARAATGAQTLPSASNELAEVGRAATAAVSGLGRSGTGLVFRAKEVALWPSILAKSAFGELLAHTGTDPQPYAFTGEPYDPNIDWQYHRARWMDPRTGRFAGMDPFVGGAFEPASLHRYGFGYGNPANWTDPSGLYTQKFGYEVEDAIEPLYEDDHKGDNVVFGRWNRVGLNPRLKPDILNHSKKQWLEIKPLSYSGIAGAVFKEGLYFASLSWASYYPDTQWTPPGGGLVWVGTVQVFVFNVGGILFYTDALDLMKDVALLASVKFVSDAYRLLQCSRLAGSALFEGARVARLAGVATTGSQSRVEVSSGMASILAAMGFPL